jgi:hypothetical protein
MMSMGFRYYVLDAEHNAVPAPSPEAWWEWFENTTNRIVDYTEVTSECHVSTVFTGLAMPNWSARSLAGGGSPPMLFETMIFGGPLDEYQWRYSSWDDAETGHKAAVRKAREAVGQKVDP